MPSLPVHRLICLGFACGIITHAAEPAPPTEGPFGSERARATIANFPSRGERSDSSIPPRSPQETVASFKLMPGMEAAAVLHEPDITQPLHLSFDERGRLWVVQFIQYPYPAGLKIVDLGDQFHATYDKVPPPPPKHDRGKDRITIHEDTDGDGTYDSHKVFLEGLNMATAVERGRGGVWVLHPPYLLFYADANNDDVPDADPVVHLAGFGLEDTHSAANSLRWGPDGWLYGAQGSGVTAKITRPGIDAEDQAFAFKGQAIWRYQPERHVFELFSEGGGNTFSLTMDAMGRAFCGTNKSSTRGVHCVQGGYYSKSWGEHGYLTNPYSFGFFGHMPHDAPAIRFSNAVMAYDEGELGEACEGRLIAGNALGRCVDLADLIPDGSTYRTHQAATFLETEDRWFRPVDVKSGPDGAVYIADWYDTRLSHMDPRDNWDKTRGRVYRIKMAGASPRQEKFDLAKKSSLELVALLSHRQAWFRRTALRVLGDRKDATVIEKLSQLSHDPANSHAVDALWGLHAVGGFTPDMAASFIEHPQASVRIWTLRLLGDRERSISPELKEALEKLAKTEPEAQVRSQLASTAKRLPGAVALPIVLALMDSPEDLKDAHIPLLLWWVLEHFTETHREQILAAFSHAGHWQSPLAKTHIIPRLAQRYASHPSPENQQMLAKLARGAPEGGRALLRKGVAEAFAGRGIGAFSPEMEAALFEGEARDFSDPTQLSLAIKRGDQAAVIGALGFIVREEAPLEADRVRVMQALADVRSDVAKPVFLEVLSYSASIPVREAALAALGRYDDKELVMQVLRLWSGLDGVMRTRVLALLVSRRSWTLELLSQVGHNGVISKAEVPDEIARRARYWNDKDINAQLDRYFGKPPAVVASAEKQRRSDDLIKVVANVKAADALAGRGIFETRCAACHKLYGRGGDTGPDLTGYERVNVPNMLLSILDPSLTIREGFATFLITTRDDRSLVGFLEERSPTRVVLRDTVGQRTSIATNDIREERVIPMSLMPEGLLDGLSHQQLRDFFAYLTSATDPPGK